MPDKAPARNATISRAKYWRALSALTKLCVPAELFETLVIRLTTRLDIICDASSSNESPDTELCTAYAHSLLVTIANTLASKADQGHTDIPKYIDRLIPRILNVLFFSALISNNRTMVATDDRIVTVTARILTSVVETLPNQ